MEGAAAEHCFGWAVAVLQRVECYEHLEVSSEVEVVAKQQRYHGQVGLTHGLGVVAVPTTYVHRRTAAEPGMRAAVHLRLSASLVDVEVEEALGWQGCQMKLFLDC